MLKHVQQTRTWDFYVDTRCRSERFFVYCRVLHIIPTAHIYVSNTSLFLLKFIIVYMCDEHDEFGLHNMRKNTRTQEKKREEDCVQRGIQITVEYHGSDE